MDFSKFFDETGKKWRYWQPAWIPSQESKEFAQYSKKEYSGQTKFVKGIAWSVDGEKLAAASDCSVHLYRPKSSKHVRELKGHKDTVAQIVWDPTNPHSLASAGKDSSVKIWDSRQSGCVRNIEAKGKNLNITWSPLGNYIAVSKQVSTVKDVVSVIDVRKGGKIIQRKEFPFMVHGMCWDRTEKYFLITTGNGTIDIMEFPKIAPALTIEAHTGHCHCLEISQDGTLLATGGVDTVVQVWDTRDMCCVRTFSRMDDPIRSISISHDKKYVASVCYIDRNESKDAHERDKHDRDFRDFVPTKSRIDISEIESGNHVHSFVMSSFEAQAIAFNPVRRLLAVAGKAAGYDNKKGVVAVYSPRSFTG
mmetsp:Transcript_28207/g.45405  ORF Transcript_28207/g.45405 Transcript_28207/m.45405 type:complete len:364 (+) Transcript_28207:125-1216(+)